MTKINAAISALNPKDSSRLIRPRDADYDSARTVMSGAFDFHPALIARVKSPRTIAEILSTARQNGVEIAIRSGGHSSAGHSGVDGGIVIDLRDMNGIEIDTATRTVWVGTGATAGELTEATTAHGLIVGFGDTASVGIGGITLGGGMGYLSRLHGLTIDALLAAEVVLADGRVVIADKDNEPELFWAIRGGGGNFGVATRFRFQLTELPAFTGGMMCLPATPETVAGFIAAATAAPEALSTIANVMPAPPMPFLPEAVHGKLVILAMLAYAGEDAAAEAALAPFRTLATPYADFVKAGPYMTTMYPPEDPDYHPLAVMQSLYMNRVGLAEATEIVDRLTNCDAAFRVAQIRVLGGAIARVAPDATAYAHRSAPILTNIAAFYTSEDDKAKQQGWVTAFASAVTQEETGAYVNFLGNEPDRIGAAYPTATLTRLRQAKRKYDPENVFSRNQNIVPG